MTFLDEADEAKRQNARKGIRKVMNLALQGGGSHSAHLHVTVPHYAVTFVTAIARAFFGASPSSTTRQNECTGGERQNVTFHWYPPRFQLRRDLIAAISPHVIDQLPALVS